ncbi:hypothetical protein AAFF_G00113650 [Aldrovandia affinis]|uniref:Uncharacterized protein n=1 Tax=Aldrovandia affinis TaxID=143900 RepID=A0AAD7RT41_9TELE|nr:hypothetical protein AAFF_G00113650 [Aldrovandia affinis]
MMMKKRHSGHIWRGPELRRWQRPGMAALDHKQMPIFCPAAGSWRDGAPATQPASQRTPRDFQSPRPIMPSHCLPIALGCSVRCADGHVRGLPGTSLCHQRLSSKNGVAPGRAAPHRPPPTRVPRLGRRDGKTDSRGTGAYPICGRQASSAR